MPRRSSQNGNFLGELLTQSQFGPKGLPNPSVLRWWIYHVPERVNEHAWPVNYRDGTLIVHTENSALANDLHYLREELLNSASKHIPRAAIKEIRVQVGSMPYRSVSEFLKRGRVLLAQDK